MELREYRKRLSLNSTSGINNWSSPPARGFSGLLGNNGSSNTNNFQFDFPRFGGLPGSHILDNGPLAKSATKSSSVSSANGATRQNSTGASLSPTSQVNGSNAASPDKNGNASATNGPHKGAMNGFFSFDTNNTINTAPNDSSSSGTPTRVFQFNSGSSTHSDSPSASSTSQAGQNSSCDTSPEPSHNSPNNPLDTIADGYVCHGELRR